MSNTRIAELETGIEALNSKIAQITRRSQSAEKVVKQAQEVKEKNANLEKENKDVSARLEKAIKDYEITMKKQEDLQAELDEMKSQSQKTDELHRVLQLTNSKLNKAKQDEKGMDDKVSNIKSRIANADKKIAQLEKQLQQMGEEQDTHLEQTDKTLSDLELAQRQVIEKETKAKNLKIDFNNITTKNKDLIQQNEKIENELKSIESKLVAQTKELKKIQDNKEETREETQEIREKIHRAEVEFAKEEAKANVLEKKESDAHKNLDI
ncbi:structural maintenance of chromosomes protein [Anaeramoeba ignava]|uniref:Structural maintenance of chromosomes protein n=1 Tax=Anaeramoeba ignava TaxID=1746090 RepID=A0A9Q0RAR9_ANAIG|nr:structural maintenance of chromosomes protein [Anaeramoeba ignava]|eukprot:Anaeramoba_ignava/a350206_666.p1 GENE.a350206_666~~a350206_666.p1  ORF type:complete len:267 (-),score=124.05 a350206_666:72-872(-)